MANKKISELTIASLPLTGAEVVPIVQDGETRKVAVTNIVKKPFSTIANLKASSDFTTSGSVVDVSGYYAIGDGGGGKFYWDATNTETDNGGTIIQVTGITTGRWLRIIDGDLNVLYFGAKGDGSFDNSTAFQNAIDFFSEGFGKVRIPIGTFSISSTVTVNKNRVHLVGSGIQSTTIKLSPTSNNFKGIVFREESDEVLYQCSIRDLSFTSTDLLYKKTAIEIWDSSSMVCENISSTKIYDSTNESIGINTFGREFAQFKNIRIQANIPVRLSLNPNNELSADHFHFQDAFLFAENNANLYIDPIYVSNLVFDGTNPFVRGTHAIYWNDTRVGGASSHNVTFNNIRSENGTDITASNVFMKTNNVFQEVALNNCRFGGTRKGLYFEKVIGLILNNVKYTGTSGIQGLDLIDCDNVSLMNTTINPNTTANLSTMREIYSSAKINSNSPIPDTCYLIKKVAESSVRPLKELGVSKYNYTGVLAVDGQIDIPVSNAGGRKISHLFVSGVSDDKTIVEGGYVIDGGGHAYRTILSGSSNFALGNISGSLCVINTTGTAIINKTALSLTVVVVAFYA